MVTANDEKKMIHFEVKRQCSFQRKRLTLIFPILVYVCNFFEIKWEFVLKTKQRLRVSQQGSVARLEFVMTHDASNDFFFDQFKMKTRELGPIEG